MRIVIILGILSIFGLYFLGIWSNKKPKTFISPVETTNPLQNEKNEAIAIATSSASPSASPTPKALTFAEMNNLYGPCANLPTLMYHHVEPEENAKKYKRTGLDVPPEMFRKQMEYLKNKGYALVTPEDLIAFFDNGTPLPSKPVILTFDDGYVDIGDEAFPIMQSLGIKGTLYIPTGLMENFDYLTWAKIDEMKSSGLINFGNHTWSHLNVGSNRDRVKTEIARADNQLAEKGLNVVKTFAYPYGIENDFTVGLLKEMKYKLAFTTVHGRIMCKEQRFSLPRIRIGNAPLSAFGL